MIGSRLIKFDFMIQAFAFHGINCCDAIRSSVE